MATMDLTNEVVRLRAELEKVSTERDMLLCEVSNLRRELELSELKNLQDDSCDRFKLLTYTNPERNKT
ncbi:hypothetical protein MSG28_011466 [Choristoneura fumiferana]|uniref:Uncharacterized protein n=1 Tax=Choristoneura fumiferana TaxID=7141 RepID=A0ACC0JNC1_CHOFU|nr:hypothetical protein MSG28_011466 [Choristoneura fumiferana]